MSTKLFSLLNTKYHAEFLYISFTVIVSDSQYFYLHFIVENN